VAFYTRSENLFVNYYSVLDVGMAWEMSQFGDLSREVFVYSFHVLCFIKHYERFSQENAKPLHVYRRLRAGVPQFAQDFYELRHEPEELEALQKQVRGHIISLASVH
jgi:hypothetical protein